MLRVEMRFIKSCYFLLVNQFPICKSRYMKMKRHIFLMDYCSLRDIPSLHLSLPFSLSFFSSCLSLDGLCYLVLLDFRQPICSSTRHPLISRCALSFLSLSVSLSIFLFFYYYLLSISASRAEAVKLASRPRVRSRSWRRAFKFKRI